jgi:hypothetical protein
MEVLARALGSKTCERNEPKTRQKVKLNSSVVEKRPQSILWGTLDPG